MKHKCKPGSPASILMGGHYSNGGEAMPSVGERRAAPNLGQRFKDGGSAMQMEDALKAMGTYSSSGSEMNKEDRKRARGGTMRRAAGGDIGTNTGSDIAREPGTSAMRKGGCMKRAMGGAAKTRKDYPNT